MRRLKNLIYGFKVLLRFDNRWQLVVNRFLFPKRGLTVYALDGMEVLVDHACGEQSSTRTCLVDGLYDPYFRAIGQQRGLTVLDLGANGGGFPLALQRFGNGIDKVVCVELNPKTHGRLVHNLSRNYGGEFAAIRGAVDGEPGELEIELGSGSVSDSIVAGLNLDRGKWQGGGKVETVRAWSLDELCQDQFPDGAPDLCKMDVEGAEYAVVLGAAATALDRIRWLLVEVHQVDGQSEETFHQNLAGRGFARVEIEEPVREDNVFLYKNNNAAD